MQQFFYFSEFGRRGQIRSINARTARQELLLPGFGVYASPYNLEKYKKIVLPEDSVQSSSETVSQCVSGKDFLIHKAPLLTFFLSKIVHWYFVSKILG